MIFFMSHFENYFIIKIMDMKKTDENTECDEVSSNIIGHSAYLFFDTKQDDTIWHCWGFSNTRPNQWEMIEYHLLLSSILSSTSAENIPSLGMEYLNQFLIDHWWGTLAYNIAYFTFTRSRTHFPTRLAAMFTPNIKCVARARCIYTPPTLQPKYRQIIKVHRHLWK